MIDADPQIAKSVFRSNRLDNYMHHEPGKLLGLAGILFEYTVVLTPRPVMNYVSISAVAQSYRNALVFVERNIALVKNKMLR
jgi:hypothetical protein